ncbi:MAG: hypothetical protein WBD07_07590 [Vicinamibacterales bacterium]
MALTPGTQLGPHQIAALIGTGGMGEVYRAHDPRLGRDVAIKVAAEAFTERFTREARAPVAFEEFADPKKRMEWARDKGLSVFSLYSPAHALTEIDLFVEPPLDFDLAYQGATRAEVAPGVEATFIGLRDLMRLKQGAARPQDLLDLENLRALRRGKIHE